MNETQASGSGTLASACFGKRFNPRRRELWRPLRNKTFGAGRSGSNTRAGLPLIQMETTIQPINVKTLEVTALEKRFQELPTEGILRWAWERFGTRAAIGTSFQGAGLVMIHLARKHNLPL